MEERFELAKKMAKEAGYLLRKEFGRGELSSITQYDVKLKQDVESERIILDRIEKSFPEDGYISEEKGEERGRSGYIWIIDPLDGTVNYYRGIPHCCVSIACIKEDDGFGVVYDFCRDELFTGYKDKGSFLNGRKIEVSKTEGMKDVILSFGLMKGREEIEAGLKIFCNIADKVKKVRMMGSAALDICYVASGRTDLFFEVGLNIWDVSAGKIILQEAGGEYKEYTRDNKNFFFVSNGLIKMECIW
ncbi:MAG: inositol monophosphatase [bacterium]|nr:inositol monophosphatase [bacterium]